MPTAARAPEAAHFEGDWEEIASRLATDPRTASEVEFLAREVPQSFRGMTIADLPSTAARSTLDLISIDAKHVFGDGVGSRLGGSDAVVMNFDDLWAESQLTHSGGHLVVLSSSLISSLAMAADVARQLNASRNAQERLLTVAVLRHNYISQWAFGINSIHCTQQSTTKIDRWIAMQQIAITFVIAHEAAHRLAEHEAASANQSDVELEADQLAGLLVRRGHLSWPIIGYDQATILDGIHLALAMLASRESSLFLRAPQSHPSLKQRWRAAADGSAVADAAWEEGALLRAAFECAGDLERELTDEIWAHLRGSELWGGQLKSELSYATTAVLDKLPGASKEMLYDAFDDWQKEGDRASRTVAPAMMSALFSQSPLSERLERCGVRPSDRKVVLAFDRPLSRRGLTSAFTRSTLWPEKSGTDERVLLAAVAATAFVRDLAEENHV